MATKNKDIFKATINGEEVELAVIRPNSVISREAQIEYNRTFAVLLKNGGILKETLDTYMRQQDLWNDEKEKKYQEIITFLVDGQNKLDKQGGIKVSEARKIALEMRRKRLELLGLLSVRGQVAMNTVEGQAEDYRFNYLVFQCLVYNNTGEKVFKSLDDYLDNSDEDYTIQGASKLASLIHGYDDDIDNSFVENRFLKKYGFVDDKLRLINKDGHLIDEDGRLINEAGNFVDKDGNLVNKDGQPPIEFKPFLDDDGNPIIIEESNIIPIIPISEVDELIKDGKISRKENVYYTKDSEIHKRLNSKGIEVRLE